MSALWEEWVAHPLGNMDGGAGALLGCSCGHRLLPTMSPRVEPKDSRLLELHLHFPMTHMYHLGFRRASQPVGQPLSQAVSGVTVCIKRP